MSYQLSKPLTAVLRRNAFQVTGALARRNMSVIILSDIDAVNKFSEQKKAILVCLTRRLLF